MAVSMSFFLFIFSWFQFATSTTFSGDIEALKSIKLAIDAATIPSGSCLASWDFTFDPCDASFSARFTCGIRCDAKIDTLSRVTEVSLDSAGYSGPLSPSIWSLPFLETLNLAENRFYGQLPPPPPLCCSRLRRLTLSCNSFSGEIPNLSPAGSLTEAYFDSNYFTGQINPANLQQLRALQRLELQSNNLTGMIPDLSMLSSLNYLDASENLLTGGFPTNLPPSLVEVSLRSNRLFGELTGPAIANLENLQVMDLSRNGLSGAVARALFEHPVLEQLTLACNQFQWVDEPRDGGLGSGLVALDLGHNRLTGLLPGFVGSMPRLAAVDLQYNKFTGMIPVQYAMRAVGAEGMVQFRRLLLSGNYLFGPIPGPMGAMKEGTAVVSLADNCLFRCPAVFFFCQDGQQKPSSTCREFNPVIP